jgi:hypothetical protein
MRPAAVPQAELRGGSDYVTHRVDGDCTREPYGVVNSYDHAPELIRDRLAQSTRAGQRRLRIPVFYHRGADSGTVRDSTGGSMPSSWQVYVGGAPAQSLSCQMARFRAAAYSTQSA